MKTFLVGLLFITVVLSGLNATAAGLHSLDPHAPEAVLSLERKDSSWQMKFLDWYF